MSLTRILRPFDAWSRRLALALVVALLPGAALAQAPSLRIAAVVNDDVITTGDLLDRINLGIATSGLPNDDATRQRLAPQILRGFIDEKLQLQEAKRLRIDVTQGDMDQAMQTIAQRNRTSVADLTRFLSDRGLSSRALQDQLRAQIAWIKVVGRELRPKIVVSQEQIDLAMRREAGADDRELALSEILLPVYDRNQEDKVLADAQGLVASLRGGGNFAAVARQVSAAASAENGGDLGWVPVAAIIPDLRDRIASLPVGQVSDPFVSPAGVHIFLVREQRSRSQGAADRNTVRQRLEQQQLERQASRYLRDLRREAYIDVRI
ncbi:MAG: peptidylprolyl isomerase [Geminicoccaceae bacterium]